MRCMQHEEALDKQVRDCRSQLGRLEERDEVSMSVFEEVEKMRKANEITRARIRDARMEMLDEVLGPPKTFQDEIDEINRALGRYVDPRQEPKD